MFRYISAEFKSRQGAAEEPQTLLFPALNSSTGESLCQIGNGVEKSFIGIAKLQYSKCQRKFITSTSSWHLGKRPLKRIPVQFRASSISTINCEILNCDI